MTDVSVLRRNAVLGRLPGPEFDRLREHLEVVQTELRQSVYAPERPIREVYFPIDSVFSIVAIADDEVVVEVATIGREGMVGLPLFLGAVTSPQAAFCQVRGTAARITADQLQEALTGDGALHRALSRLTQATMAQIAQNVVCNATHSTEQRAARWLLMTHDRLGRDEFELTQEFLAQMLGVRRPTVSEVATRLQSQGQIRYVRGRMSLLDRTKLEATTCPCYGLIRREFDELTRGNGACGSSRCRPSPSRCGDSARAYCCADARLPASGVLNLGAGKPRRAGGGACDGEKVGQ